LKAELVLSPTLVVGYGLVVSEVTVTLKFELKQELRLCIVFFTKKNLDLYLKDWN